MFCSNCGALIDDNAKFCGKCGAKAYDSSALNSQKSDNQNTPNYESVTEKTVPVVQTAPSVSSEFSDIANQEYEPQKPCYFLKKHPSVFVSIITVLLAVTLFIVSSLAFGINGIRNMFKEDNVEDLLKNVDIGAFMADDLGFDDVDTEELYDFLSQEYGIEANNRKLQNFIEESTVPEYIAEKVSRFVERSLERRARLVVTEEDIEELIDENIELIEDEFDTKLNRQEVRRISDWMIKGDELVIVNTRDLEEDNGKILDTIRNIFSGGTVIMLLIISVLIIIGMIFNNMPQAISSVGIVAIFQGAVSLVVTLLGALIASFFSSAIDTLIINVVKMNLFFYVALIIFGIGLLLLKKYYLNRFFK